MRCLPLCDLLSSARAVEVLVPIWLSWPRAALQAVLQLRQGIACEGGACEAPGSGIGGIARGQRQRQELHASCATGARQALLVTVSLR